MHQGAVVASSTFVVPEIVRLAGETFHVGEPATVTAYFSVFPPSVSLSVPVPFNVY